METFTQPDSFTESSVDFLIVNSDEDELESLPDWDLITGLPALRAPKLYKSSSCKQLKGKIEMTSNKNLTIFPSSSEENEGVDAAVPLVPDTASECSDTFSNAERNNNVAVVERNKSNAKPKDSKLRLLNKDLDEMPCKVIPDSQATSACENVVLDSDVSQKDFFKLDTLPETDNSANGGDFKKASFAESQSFHLVLTQSVTEDCVVEEPIAVDEVADTLDDSEGSVSVFKNVKSSCASPKKTRNVEDVSKEFLSTRKSAADFKSERKISPENNAQPARPFFSRYMKDKMTDQKNGSKGCMSGSPLVLNVVRESKYLAGEMKEKRKDSVKSSFTLISEKPRSRMVKSVAPKDMDIVISDESDMSAVDSTQSYDYQVHDFLQTVDYRSDRNDSEKINMAETPKNDQNSSSDVYINPSQKRLPPPSLPRAVNSDEEQPGLKLFCEQWNSTTATSLDERLNNDGSQNRPLLSSTPALNINTGTLHEIPPSSKYDQSTPSTSRLNDYKSQASNCREEQPENPDVYIFKNSQLKSANATATNPVVSRLRKPVRIVKIKRTKKALKSSKLQNESSTDEWIEKTRQRCPALKGKKKNMNSIQDSASNEIKESGQSQFTGQKKKCDNLPSVTSGTSSDLHKGHKESSQQNFKFPSTSVEQMNKSLKGESVHFSQTLHSEGRQHATDNDRIEVKKVIRTVNVKITITQRVVTETLNSLRTLLERRENEPVVVSHKEFVYDESEQVSEQVIKGSISPSSLSTGELADVSSLSKSSGSGQNMTQPPLLPPKIETLHKDLQKHNSPGIDLISTPNLTLIEHVDSQMGKMMVSLTSSPSLPHASPVKETFADIKQNSPLLLSEDEVQDKSEMNSAESTTSMANAECSLKSRKRSSSRKESESGNSNAIESQRPQPRGIKRKLETESIRKESQDKQMPSSSIQSDVQSTGFNVPTGSKEQDSGKSEKSSKSGSDVSKQISLQCDLTVNTTAPLVLLNFTSKPEIGAKVMAKWNDGFYYAGVMTQLDTVNQKYKVKYDDGSQRWAKAEDILLSAELPVGQSVLVLRETGFYEPGMILRHSEAASAETSQPQLNYHVELDDGTLQICDRGKLMLSEDQANCLLGNENIKITLDPVTPSRSKPGEVSLDNIVDGKRQPRITKSLSALKEKRSAAHGPSTSCAVAEDENPPSSKKKKICLVSTSTPNKKQVSRNPKTPEKQTSAVNIGGAVVSPAVGQRSPSKACKGLFQVKNKKLSKIFDGMKFILTHVEKTAQSRSEEKKLLQDSSLESSVDESTDLESDVPPFVKEQIESLIIQGGGTVVKSFDDVTLKSKEKIYLVAAEHQRTYKYMQALAARIPIVSHQWILHSAEKNSLQPSVGYKLPAGISLEKKKIMEDFRLKGCRGLENLITMIVSTNELFTKSWTSILTSAGCNIVTKIPASASKYDPGVDVVIADPTCPVSLVRKCQRLNIPLVSSEWVVQCLVNSELVGYNGHENYKYDFKQT